ncbi:cupin domain-containing protein [Erythrobacter donghaensis]|uniref:cupin domain-containing protein n=1 Tax=Erythrobacter donghaensis TaxID=267135 RepID=UPI0018C6653B|nr:hypothetical protein [Erythrobacter donghaensis]
MPTSILKPTPPLATHHVRLTDSPIIEAIDGVEVRPLCVNEQASLAYFYLGEGKVSQWCEHLDFDEFWFVLSGSGRIAVKARDGASGETQVSRGSSLIIPKNSAFQVFAMPHHSLEIVACSVPPFEERNVRLLQAKRSEGERQT